MNTIAFWCLLLCTASFSFAETRDPNSPYSPEKLKQMSTVVFRGKVLKIETNAKYKVSFPVEAAVDSVVKGTLKKEKVSFGYKHPGRCLILEKEFNKPEVGMNGTFYFQGNEDHLVLIGFIKEEPKGITDRKARELAIGHYRKLFSDKYYFNPVDKKYHRFPKLDATFFHKAEVKDGCWQLAGDPPAGIHVYAKVDLKGNWVQVTRVGFATD